MTAKDVTSMIAEYLTSPGPEKRAIVEKLAETPDVAFTATLRFRGPYPESLHPRDVHDTHLVDLMTELLKQFPHLFTECELKNIDRFQRHPLICAAISTHDPQFTDAIIGALKDRSIYIKILVMDAIGRHHYLRTAEAKKQLERLLTVKSIAESNCDRAHVEKALAAFNECVSSNPKRNL
ncbi:MAG: hypothetical protein CMM00_01990 [Rhodopirellula sp.]|uniref:hypothetical protein n=1 Tax=Rhodopirellula TaxID=265488 RepID=UPI000C3B9C62|nr:hypothetical protein [Rhodopirellula sp. UBA1907]MAP07635.1 hypothetical protein [Rhodopirellula sp.]|tara:strand:+ start:115 stop:654 length:540 start_codon:yes stop_codon:yes gene_type:complete